METFLLRALQHIMRPSLLVIIHEMGHFLFARLFKYKPNRSETQCPVGCTPLGASVKLSGMMA